MCTVELRCGLRRSAKTDREPIRLGRVCRFALATVYALVSLYWAVGGTRGINTLGQPLERLARSRTAAEPSLLVALALAERLRVFVLTPRTPIPSRRRPARQSLRATRSHRQHRPCRRTSGPVTATASLSNLPPPICLRDGATLTVVFEKSTGGLGVPGPWGVPPVGVTPDGILTISSTTQSGDRLTAVFATRTAGTVAVSGYYANECGAGEATPCTIPPLSTIPLSVTVVSP